MHPQGCQILSLDPLLFGFNHMPVTWCIRQDWLPKPCYLGAPSGIVRCREPQSHLQTLRSKRRMIIISPRMRNGADGETCTLVGQCPAVYKTAAVAAEPRRHGNGLPSRSLCTRTVKPAYAQGFGAAAMLSLRCERRLVGRLGIAPSSRRLRAGTSLSKFATLGPSARIAPRRWS